MRRWESVACEWVRVVDGSGRDDGTVEVVYPDGRTLRVADWILHEDES